MLRIAEFSEKRMHELTAFYRQIHPLKGMNFHVPDPIGLGEVAYLDDRIRHCPCSSYKT